MAMQERLVRFTLFGQEFTFYSDAPAEETDAVIALLRRELEGGIASNKSMVPSSKMLVLGCLQIAARLVEMEHEYNQFRRDQQKTVTQLVEKITAVVEPPA